MIRRYCPKKNSKSEPPGIKLKINGGSVTFEKPKKHLKLGNALIIKPIQSVTKHLILLKFWATL